MRRLDINETKTDAIEPVLITSRQVAVMLQVSNRTVWRMLAAKFLPEPIRVGKVVRWKVDEIETWIAAGCRRWP